ncbi:MAG TPA: hypothetical protein VFH61_02790 [Thermoleophilia bacterium]|nr:hypothetical protein [Thermoleophilia bacterium]
MSTPTDPLADFLWAVYTLQRTDARRNALIVHYLPRAIGLLSLAAQRHTLDIRLTREDRISIAGGVLLDIIPHYDPFRGRSFVSYAYGQMVYALRELRRTPRRKVRPVMHPLSRSCPDPEPGPAELAEAADEAEHMLDIARNALGGQDYDIFYRHYAKGETIRALGDDYGVPHTTILKICRKAMARVRRYAKRS